MHPIRTPSLNGTYGGDGKEVMDLPFRRDILVVSECPVTSIACVWTFSEEEREAIAEGANVEVNIIGMEPIPPTSLHVTDEQEAN